jgi:hypothetical protein
MTRSDFAILDDRRVDGVSARARLERLEWLAHILDTALVVPGTNFRFGADAVLGLAPGLGDAITTALSCWIVYEARRLGAPPRLILRMIGNVAIDGFVGAIPIAGDVFDTVWRANRRNVTLLRRHLEDGGIVRVGV